MNKFQILGIIAAALALTSVGSFYVYKPIGADMTKSSSIPQVLLSLAVGTIAVALIISQSSGLNTRDDYVPHVIHPPTDQNFIMKEGLKKPQPSKPQSLGRRLKDSGWIVVFADWCGYCTRQKKMFDELADHELNLIVIKEGDQDEGHKALNKGYPAFMCKDKGLMSPGFKANIKDIEALLDMK
jgi:thiol-disulfide isomerase/thioredoxin